MEKLAIGVDVGTTQAKAVAFQANGTVVASSYVRYPLIQETEGMAEQDPETLFQAVVNCIRTVTQQVKNQPIGLISFASAMHGLIAMDAQGRPLTQVITWADTRASDYAEALRNASGPIVLSIDRHASSSNGAFIQDSLAAGKSASRCAERGQVYWD